MNLISKLRFNLERTIPMLRKKRIRRDIIFSLNGGFESRELPDVGQKSMIFIPSLTALFAGTRCATTMIFVPIADGKMSRARNTSIPGPTALH